MAPEFSYFKVIEMNEFLGKVAVITGAGSGIGRALAVSLAQQGCNLALADINTESLEQTQVILDSDLLMVASRSPCILLMSASGLMFRHLRRVLKNSMVE